MPDEMDSLKIEKKEGYLLVVFPPYHSLEVFEKYFSEMYEAVNKYKSPRVLIDVLATKEKVPILELYELGCYMAEKNMDKKPRIAGIASKEAVYSDKFFQNVVRNRGVDLLRFVESYEEAFDWLEVEV